jgi:PilZ domain-containing protein
MSDQPWSVHREFQRELVQTETLVIEMRQSGGRSLAGRSRNLSLAGIYVETAESIDVGAEVQLFVGSTSSPAALRVIAEVVHVEPGSGFGARFLDDSAESRECITTFLARVSKSP